MENSYWVTQQSNSLKLYRKHVKIFVEAMDSYPRRIGEAQFLKETEEKFIALLPGLPLHPGSKKHLFNELMPALATITSAYLVLKDHGYTVDQIGRLEYEGYLQYFNKIPRPIRFLARRFMVSTWFSKLMGPTVKKMTESGREDTFFIKYDFQKSPCRATTMTCRQCAMVTFMKKNNLEELKRLCNVFDFAQAESFGLGLQQPSCIGSGDADCRYLFTNNKRDTVLPGNITAILSTPMDH